MSLTFKNLSLRKLVLLLALVLVSLVAISLGPKKASAASLISNVAPVPASGCVFGSCSSSGATTTHPWFAVGEGQYDGDVSYAKVYVPNNTTSVLTVVNGFGVCGPDIGSPRVSFSVRALGDDETYFGNGYNNGSPIPAQRNTDNSNCAATMNFTLNASTTGIAATNVPGAAGTHGKYHVFYFEAQLISTGTGDNEKNFRLRATNGALVGVSAPAQSYAKPWFGIYQRDEPTVYGGNNWNWSVNFGARCDETPSPTPKTISVHDIDWQQYPQDFLFETVKQDSRTNGSTPNWVNAAPGGSFSTFRTFSKSPPNAPPGDPNGFKDANQADDNLSYTSVDTNRYGIFFQDINWRNTIQIAIPYDQFDGSDALNCPQPSVACNSIQSTNGTNLALNQGTQVNLTIKNTSAAGQNFPGTYEIRQINVASDLNSAPGGGAVPLGSTLTGGSTSPPIGPFNINARSSPTSLNFYYALFDGSGGGAGSVGKNPLCRITINWGGAKPGGSGSISVSCTAVKIYGVNVPATYHKPWVLGQSVGPPIGAPPKEAIPTRIGNVPAQVVITDVNDATQTSTYPVPGGVPNDGSSKTLSPGTFSLWGGMLMHKVYRLDLVLQGVAAGSDSFAYDNNGAWGPAAGGTYYSTATVSSDTTDICMDAYCGGGSPADLEPGQSDTFHYGIHIVNLTSRTYNTGDGYGFTVGTDGGFANVGGASVNPTDFPSGDVPVDISFSARLDYKGSFWATLTFRGNPMTDLSRLESPCPGKEVIPATRPYFEVRAGDLSTGGGFTSFRNGDNSCGDTAAGDSQYVSPQTGYSPGGPPYDYAGGVRAFGTPNKSIGSFVQYGAYSVGLTIGSLGGPIGFYSGDGGLFANKPDPASSFGNINSQGYSGYLNSTKPAHCTPVDFYNKTRIGTPADFSTIGSDLNNASNAQYQAPGGTTINGATIPVGRQVTLYVDGDLNINGDIKYATGWNPNNQDEVPYLVIIVRGGDIILSNNVRQLDGLYIVQPNGTSGGHFDTCDSSSFCPDGLVVNGAIIAQQVDLLRAHGSVGPCDGASPTCQLITNQPAEVINFAPSMIIGLPNLLQNNGGAIIPSAVEGIFSLPPVF